MSTTKSRIAVIGGGITGAFATYFLARLGAEATIIERDQIAAKASGKNPGGLNPLHGPGIPGPMQALALESFRLHLENWPEIQRLSRIDFRARFVPRLFVAMDEQDSEALSTLEVLHNSTPGFSARRLSRSDLRLAESRVSPDAVGGLWTERNAVVESWRYTRALVRAAVSLGARAIKAEACGLHHRDGRVTGVVLDAGSLDCDGVLIATGPWCEEPAEWLGVRLPVEPLKGELLLAEPNAEPLAADVTWREFGAYDAGGGRLWLGGTEDRAGFDTVATGSARSRILAGIERLLPGLGMQVTRQIAGLRPVTPDGFPIVGIPAGWENACVALGAGRKGVLLSAGLGLAAAELLTAGKTNVPVAASAPARPGLDP